MPRTRTIWTHDMKYALQELYGHVPGPELAVIFNTTVPSIHGQAKSLGLKKSEAFLRSSLSGKLQKGNSRGASAWFKKGQVPINKGKKLTEEQRKKSQHTWFKKGHKPHNTKHDLAISLRKNNKGDSYYFIRVSPRNWVHLHRWIWEQENGPVPPGGVIVFKDGNRLNVTIDNLELITQEENMLRNSIHNYPAEMVQVIYTMSQLTKAIKKYAKKESERPEG